jgi:DNA-binding NarL/FixJ family response regulator
VTTTGQLTLSDLTPRQREVALLVAQGLTRARIAEQLSHPTQRPLSIRTVDVHIQTIAGRLPNDGLPATRRVRRWARAQVSI